MSCVVFASGWQQPQPASVGEAPGTLRVGVGRHCGPAPGPVGVALPAMLERLDIAAADVGAEAWYLLFAGRDGEPRGGSEDLIGTFRCPVEGKTKFLELQAA